MVQPEPKWYRISYAMLKNAIKKPKVRRNASVSNAINKRLPKDKFGNAILLALEKHMIDEDDIEIKLLELQTMSEEDFNAYMQELKQADNIVATNAAQELENQDTSNMTEAEIMLAKVKNGGAVIGDFSNMDNVHSIPNDIAVENEQRSLADIQSDRKLDLEMEYATLNANSTKASIDDCVAAVQQMRKTTAKQQPMPTQQNSMSNLKGLKTPIVQPPHKMNMAELFSDFKWSLGPR